MTDRTHLSRSQLSSLFSTTHYNHHDDDDDDDNDNDDHHHNHHQQCQPAAPPAAKPLTPPRIVFSPPVTLSPTPRRPVPSLTQPSAAPKRPSTKLMRWSGVQSTATTPSVLRLLHWSVVLGATASTVSL
ncbi:hypothetical protein LX36DRAFT_703148 [Colletotrichum falcatum]|nr:hypothetical protein LX36DRAFT_703148 [Colletotrichum falcatum]